jgi:hypothetical protein
MIGPKVPRQTSGDERRAREVVRGRDDGRCVRCRRHGPANWDHRKNASQGGLWAPSNGQLLCGSGTTGCHGWKTSNPAEAIAEGWAVPGWADPLVWPARRWVATSLGTLKKVWVLYDDRGGFKQITDDEAARRLVA